MLENLEHVTKAVGMAVGDERNVHFWLDCNAEPSRLLIFATQYVPTKALEHQVCDY